VKNLQQLALTVNIIKVAIVIEAVHPTLIIKEVFAFIRVRQDIKIMDLEDVFLLARTIQIIQILQQGVQVIFTIIVVNVLVNVLLENIQIQVEHASHAIQIAQLVKIAQLALVVSQDIIWVVTDHVFWMEHALQINSNIMELVWILAQLETLDIKELAKGYVPQVNFTITQDAIYHARQL
jgi:hypothetical protein